MPSTQPRRCLLLANSLGVSFGVCLFGCVREARGFTAGLRGGLTLPGSGDSGGFIDPRWDLEAEGSSKKKQ